MYLHLIVYYLDLHHLMYTIWGLNRLVESFPWPISLNFVENLEEVDAEVKGKNKRRFRSWHFSVASSGVQVTLPRFLRDSGPVHSNHPDIFIKTTISVIST